MTIPFATNSNMVISKYATEGLKKIFRSGFNYKKSGVIVMAINSIKNYQTNLFENENPIVDISIDRYPKSVYFESKVW